MNHERRLFSARSSARQSESDIQRYRNSVCLAYGFDSETFKEFIAKAELPADRLANCKNEYAQVKWAFVKTIAPFINQTAAADARTRTWVPPEGGGGPNYQGM